MRDGQARSHWCAGLVAWCLLIASASASAADAPPQVPLAVGYGKLDYVPPAVGSYGLPPLGAAADGEVIDSRGVLGRLHDHFADKIVLLGFIYSHCSDINGCPLTGYVFYKLKAAMQEDAVLADRLRLVSLSFDPGRDTPEVMRLYGANFRYAGDAGEWSFLTTESASRLKPILAAYDQDVQQQLSLRGDPTGDYSHLLRVYLVDARKRIRNIYSAAFLHPQLVLNDVRALLLEEAATSAAVETPKSIRRIGANLSRPGDDKRGYESADYQTRSQAIESRQGERSDLMAFVERVPLGLPPVPVPADNPITRAKIDLGRKLFFDRRLSLNQTISCAMCHVPEQGFTSNELAMAVGMEGRSGRRNSPTIYNTAYFTRLFHDGREETLEQQIWGPLLARNEMANPSVGAVLKKIRMLSDYGGLFEKAFDGRGPTMETVGMAIATYERALVSANSAFDRWYYGKDSAAISKAAKRGFELFTGKAGCGACHTVSSDQALFTDDRMHNTGLGYRESMGLRPDKERVQLAPGVFAEVDREVIQSVGEAPPADLGLYEVTQDPADRWKYRTPSLRNVALTAPYMHNGAFSTLDAVVRFYNDGGVPNEVLDPLIRPLNLSDADIADLVTFLESLSGANVDRVVADAFSAPIGDPVASRGDPSVAPE